MGKHPIFEHIYGMFIDYYVYNLTMCEGFMYIHPI